MLWYRFTGSECYTFKHPLLQHRVRIYFVPNGRSQSERTVHYNHSPAAAESNGSLFGTAWMVYRRHCRLFAVRNAILSKGCRRSVRPFNHYLAADVRLCTALHPKPVRNGQIGWSSVRHLTKHPTKFGITSFGKISSSIEGISTIFHAVFIWL